MFQASMLQRYPPKATHSNKLSVSVGTNGFVHSIMFFKIMFCEKLIFLKSKTFSQTFKLTTQSITLTTTALDQNKNTVFRTKSYLFNSTCYCLKWESSVKLWSLVYWNKIPKLSFSIPYKSIMHNESQAAAHFWTWKRAVLEVWYVDYSKCNKIVQLSYYDMYKHENIHSNC